MSFQLFNLAVKNQLLNDLLWHWIWSIVFNVITCNCSILDAYDMVYYFLGLISCTIFDCSLIFQLLIDNINSNFFIQIIQLSFEFQVFIELINGLASYEKTPGISSYILTFGLSPSVFFANCFLYTYGRSEYKSVSCLTFLSAISFISSPYAPCSMSSIS
jgi:hypothetical protein